MERRAEASSLWIHSAAVDLVCFGFAWVPVFAAFVWCDRYAWSAGGEWLAFWVLAFNFVHRHLTFPLVYGDPEQFAARRSAYLGLPVFFIGLTLFGFFWMPPLFSFLQVLALVWTLYHSVMQKVGLLRVYSLRSGSGRRWLDKTLLFGWLACIALFIVSDRGRAADPVEFLGLDGYLSPMALHEFGFMPLLAVAGLVAALSLTGLYLRDELRAGTRGSLPKLLFALSFVLLTATFAYDLTVGFVVFSFSHAVEYIVFVNVYARRKYAGRAPQSSLMARAVHRQGRAMALYCSAVVPAFLLWNGFAGLSLEVYITATAFLHFIYDGWIWKLRRPAVAAPLAVGYREAPAI